MDAAISSSGTGMGGASPNVNGRRAGGKVLIFLATNGVVVPVLAIFIQAFLKQWWPQPVGS